LALGTPTITPEKIGRLSALLKDKLYNSTPELKQAYARLMLQEVRVRDDEIRISGSKAVLARCASEGIGTTAPGVLSFVQEWRTDRIRTCPSAFGGQRFFREFSCYPGVTPTIFAVAPSRQSPN
jgi:hypothetical protein